MIEDLIKFEGILYDIAYFRASNSLIENEYYNYNDFIQLRKKYKFPIQTPKIVRSS